MAAETVRRAEQEAVVSASGLGKVRDVIAFGAAHKEGILEAALDGEVSAARILEQLEIRMFFGELNQSFRAHFVAGDLGQLIKRHRHTRGQDFIQRAVDRGLGQTCP